MITHKDLEFRSIFVLDCTEERTLRVCNGELLFEDKKEKKTLTKMPFQKILILFVVGHIHISTPLIEKCKANNVAIVVVKSTLRPIFLWADGAEANFLLRRRQYEMSFEDLSIARRLVENKILNHVTLLERIRKKNTPITNAIKHAHYCLSEGISNCSTLSELLALEGREAKQYFTAYFDGFNWQGRKPRIKSDFINVALDIGYTHLFNLVECFVRMFGFDIYVGVYHRLWFKRKSLICDLVEPFRCIIDNAIRSGINRKQIKEDNFENWNGEFRLKLEHNKAYNQFFFNALIVHKKAIFTYVQQYYRAFMQQKESHLYPMFKL